MLFGWKQQSRKGTFNYDGEQLYLCPYSQSSLTLTLHSHSSKCDSSVVQVTLKCECECTLSILRVHSHSHLNGHFQFHRGHSTVTNWSVAWVIVIVGLQCSYLLSIQSGIHSVRYTPCLKQGGNISLNSRSQHWQYWLINTNIFWKTNWLQNYNG